MWAKAHFDDRKGLKWEEDPRCERAPITLHLNYVTVYRNILKSDNKHCSLRVTILLGIILGAIVYGSVKAYQMGGLNPWLRHFILD